MNLTSETWKKGIADSHYTGVANLRNVRIDDVGVLRVTNKPQKVADVTGRVLEVRKGYYDVSNDWYALIGENADGRGALYNSKSGNTFTTGDTFSGGVTYRNYFIPFATTPNEEIGYFEDTTGDGNFDSYTKPSSWNALVTKGQVQNKFVQQGSSFTSSTISMVTDTLYVAEISNKAYIKSIDGSTDVAIDNSSYTSSIKDVVKVSSTAVGVVTSDMMYVYDLSGTELATLAYDFTLGDDLQHLEAKYYDNNKFVVLYQTRELNSKTVDYATGSGIDFDNFPGNSNWDTNEFNDDLQDYNNDYFSDNGTIYKLSADYERVFNFFDDYVEDVYTSVSNFPATGDENKLYIDSTALVVYSWNGSSYVVNSSYLAYNDNSDFPAIGNSSVYYLDISSERGYYWEFVYNFITEDNSATDAGDTFDNPEDLLRYRTYSFNGVDTITYESQQTVWNGEGGELLIKDSHLAVIDEEDIAVIYQTNSFYDSLPYLKVFEGSSWTEQESITFEEKYYGNIEGYGNGLIMLGNLTSYWAYDDSANEISLVDDTIIAPNDIRSVGASGDYFAMRAGSSSAIYKYVVGAIDKTPSLVSIDGFIYYGNGNSVGSLQEIAGQVFDPTDDTTYHRNVDALDLPLSTKITAIADIGTYLAIGTASGLVYFWDRLSDSYEIPVNIGEEIAEMKSKNNILYITTQKAGNVYIANLSSYEKNKNFSSLTPYRFDSVCGGMEFFDNGAYMGAKVINDETLTGIWVFENGAWSLIGTDEEVTSITKSAPNVVVFATLDGLYELDISGSPSASWPDDGAYIVSNMEVVGTVKNKKQVGNYEIYFDRPFGSNEYVKIYSRTTTNGEWEHTQTVTSDDLVATSGLYAFTGQLNAYKTEQIQYKIVLNTTAKMWKFETR